MTPAPARALGVAALAAAALPSLIAFNLPPSPTFFNQAAAVAGWGLFAALCAAAAPLGPAVRAVRWPLAALGILALGAAAAGPWAGLPATLALSAGALLAAAAVMLLAGASQAGAGPGAAGSTAFFAAWVATGVACLGVAMVQVFAPGWADGTWIARSGFEGRAVGNLRQPNHLSSLLLWSIIAVIALGQLRRWRWPGAAVLVALLVLGVQLTGSRTGTVGVALLALWGLLDRRLPTPARVLLLATPFIYAAVWAVLAAWPDAAGHAVGAATRVGERDLSASRFGIWANTVALIQAHPWAGVGFGGFNFAWTLTPFPGRPVAFFDHTHNLPLQLWVELGVPAGTLVMVLLLAGLWQGWRRAWGPVAPQAAGGPGTGGGPGAGGGLVGALAGLLARRVDADAPHGLGPARRAAVVMLVMIGLHSLLEYPLWYAYFLLPAAWAWGLGLAPQGADAAPSPAAAAAPRTRPLLVAGLGLAIAAVAALGDYMRVSEIFAPGTSSRPLDERIAIGQRSVLFGHHADYARATTGEPSADELPAFGRAVHYLLDARLMMAWARTLHAAGDEDLAAHVAQRLREFRNPQAEAFFAGCEAAPGVAGSQAASVASSAATAAASSAAPTSPGALADGPAPAAAVFPCAGPAAALGWRDFLER